MNSINLHNIAKTNKNIPSLLSINITHLQYMKPKYKPQSFLEYFQYNDWKNATIINTNIHEYTANEFYLLNFLPHVKYKTIKKAMFKNSPYYYVDDLKYEGFRFCDMRTGEVYRI